MKTNAIVVSLLLLLASGCAVRPAIIEPIHTPDREYAGVECRSLYEELSEKKQRETVLVEKQKLAHKMDIMGVTAGLAVHPIFFLYMIPKTHETEIAELRGEIIAIENNIEQCVEKSV